jgi:hypothetical protein
MTPQRNASGNALRKALADALHRIQEAAKGGVIRTSDMSRVDRERAQAAGWLHPIINGWYIVGSEAAAQSGSTALWFSHFWPFIQRYLNERFGDGYCLNAEASLDLHVGNTTVPRQLIVMTSKGGATNIQLPDNTSLQTYPDPGNLPEEVEIHSDIRIMPLAVALSRAMPIYFRANPVNAEIALNLVTESDLSRALIAGRNTRAASRLMGAYQFLGNKARAQRIKNDMQAGVSRISPVNPFTTEQPLLESLKRVKSPQVARLTALWKKMRPAVLEHFPQGDKPTDIGRYMDSIEDIYQHDAYNSLSIEGYRVTPEIIERVRAGDWNPEQTTDREHVAAMAAKGYFDAFQRVKQAVQDVLQGANPTTTAQSALQDWYRALFNASVQAGILEPVDLAGYRNRPVYIRGSMHVPPPHEALMDCMDTLFDLLESEKSAAVRAILGHFIFVFVHPYPDGNGRLGRFLMNLMLASGGYPWTVIRLEQRDVYMNALEQASAHQEIGPFAEFVAQEMRVNWAKRK